jgi:NADPH:quinone reductase-like Zn-dependent oxidoreductase
MERGNTMRAWAIEAYGGPEQLKLMELPVPQLRTDDDVLMRMHGAEVGDWDALVREGGWPMERPFPLVLGLAGSGSVETVGPGVTQFKRGDVVFAYSYPLYDNGAWAEYMLVPSDYVAHAPQTLDPVRAGGVPVVGLTAHETLNDILEVVDGDAVLITPAAGGVGHLAVQIATELGGRVVATASPHNHGFVRSLGARWLIDYRTQDVVVEVRKLFPEGVDKILSGLTRSEAANQAARTLRKGGRMVDLPGKVTEVPKGVEVIGDYVVEGDGLRLQLLAAMIDAGRLKVEVQQVFPFDIAPQALAKVLEGHVRGKIVIGIG